MKSAFSAISALLLSAPTAHAQLRNIQRRARPLQKGIERRRDLQQLSMPMSMSIMSNEEAIEPSFVTANKMTSSKKDKNAQKGDDRSLVAVIGTNNLLEDGTEPVTGIVSVNYNSDGAFLLSFDVAGVPLAILPDGTPTDGVPTAVASISNATSCSELDEFTFMRALDPILNDPELLLEQFVLLYPSDVGFSNDAARINNGFGANDNRDYAVVIASLAFPPDQSQIDGVIGCGILGYASDNEPNDSMVLKATIGVYPEYTPGLEVSGSVVVSYRADSTFEFMYDLEGVDPACAEGCGIHIHAGTSCETADQVLGHGWNSEVVQDLWTTSGGAVYVANDNGKAEGFFNLHNGFSFGKNQGHAVVVHTADGSRVGCGVLEAFV